MRQQRSSFLPKNSSKKVSNATQKKNFICTASSVDTRGQPMDLTCREIEERPSAVQPQSRQSSQSRQFIKENGRNVVNAGCTTTTLFSSTTPGTYTNVIVPAGVTTLNYTIVGGSGGGDGSSGPGGNGASIVGTLLVTPGDNLTLTVGANGTYVSAGIGVGGMGAGKGGSSPNSAGGGGGGSEIFDTSNTSNFVIAGGGGGGLLGYAGGNAGSAGAGTGAGGQPGTQTAPGAGGGTVGFQGSSGSGMNGGNGWNGGGFSGGGGGGGYYGGGGGGGNTSNFANGGGGGGSSYTSAPGTTATIGFDTTATPQITLTYCATLPPQATLFSSTTPGTYTTTVPCGVTQLNYTIVGGSGGNGYVNTSGGIALGESITGTMTVAPGDNLTLTVGANGSTATSYAGGAGGTGSGNGGAGNIGSGGGGGGSEIYDNTTIPSGSNFIIAGGAGGTSNSGGSGGNGGLTTGQAGGGGTGGGGGTQTGPGTGGGGGGADGSVMNGGSGSGQTGASGGGGGGGYYGGGSGGGSIGGGGGGSSWTSSPGTTVTGSSNSATPRVILTYTPPPQTTLFSSTISGTYSVIVPNGVTNLSFNVIGGSGGSVVDSGPGGQGASITGNLPVTPGDSLTLTIARNGAKATNGGAGGFGIGSGGSSSPTSGGAGGGGGSEIIDNSNGVYIIAGGGGGSGEAGVGGNSGQLGGGTDGGGAGTQTSGGAAGSLGATAGTGPFGNGGTGSANSGGGGGGYYGGGGGGADSGGGGGSSYVPLSIQLGGATQSFDSTATPQITLTYSACIPPQTLLFSSTTPGSSTVTVPCGVTSLNYTIVGGSGGNSDASSGGKGASITGTIPVTPGDVLDLTVGANGQGYPTGNAGGLGVGNGGAGAGSGTGSSGGGGGGSEILDTTSGLFVIAGAGGGASSTGDGPGGNAGAMGGQSSGGGPGTQTGPGAGGAASTPGNPGSANNATVVGGGAGGAAPSSTGAANSGGGGGGYYGGGSGGGSDGGGGGGSSWTSSPGTTVSSSGYSGTPQIILSYATLPQTTLFNSNTNTPTSGPGTYTVTVPPCVTSLNYTIVGGTGGNSNVGSPPGIGGEGAYITGTIPVTPGDILDLTVGANASASVGGMGAGIGGNGGTQVSEEAGGGGGGSEIIDMGPTGTSTTGLFVVAGGGGGAGYTSDGGAAGQNGQSVGSAGGIAGNQSGPNGQSETSQFSGGGGGGYHGGGGGGQSSGGGGGTNYTSFPGTLVSTIGYDSTATPQIILTYNACEACPTALPITVSKTAMTEIDTLYTWGITKSANPTSVTLVPGTASTPGATTSVTYTVTATEESESDTYTVYGNITITNPNPSTTTDDVLIQSVQDPTGTPASGTPTLPYLLMPQQTLTVPYSYTVTSSGPGVLPPNQTNTASVTAQNVKPDGVTLIGSPYTITASAPYSFSSPTVDNVTDGTVSIDDTMYGAVGPSSAVSGTPYTYTETIGPYSSCGSYTVNNTADLIGSHNGVSDGTTIASASASVAVTVMSTPTLTVSKTANTEVTRTYEYTISKTPSPSTVNLNSPTATAPVNYKVVVTPTSYVDSNYEVYGSITITNPATAACGSNVTVNSITDSLSGATFQYTTTTAPPFILAPGQSTVVNYSAFLSSASDTTTGTNSVTVNSSAGSFTASAPYSFVSPTTINPVDQSVTINDTDPANPVLGTTTFQAGPVTYTYTDTVGPYTTCGAYTITDTVTVVDNASGSTVATANATVNVNVSTTPTLNVSKTANTEVTRTYQWSATKTVTPTTLSLATGASAPVTYTVTATPGSYTDSAYEVYGNITITNPGTTACASNVTITSISDSLSGAVLSNPTFPYSLAPGATLTVPYYAMLSSGSDTTTGTNSVTVNSSAGSFTASAAYSFVTPTTINPVNNKVTITDSLYGSLGTTTYPTPFKDVYTETIGPYTACGSYSVKNTVNVVNGSTVLATASATVAVTVTGGTSTLKVTKTANTEVTRTYKWSISKTANPTAVTLKVGLTSPVAYKVVVTPSSYTDSNPEVYGNIVITNTGSAGCGQSIKITSIKDSLTGCTLNTPTLPYTLASGASVTVPYSAFVSNENSGTNTVTVVATIGTTSTTFTASAPYSFATPTTINAVNGTVTVTDTDPAHSTLGTTTAQAGPVTYTYTDNVGPIFSCGKYTITDTVNVVNSSNVVVATSSASVAVTIPCNGCALSPNYWKNNTNDPSWQILSSQGCNMPFFSSGKTWIQILNTAPSTGIYYALAIQYIAAQLNIFEATDPTAIESVTMTAAKDLFQNYTPAQVAALSHTSPIYIACNAGITILTNYNNGNLQGCNVAPCQGERGSPDHESPNRKGRNNSWPGSPHNSPHGYFSQ